MPLPRRRPVAGSGSVGVTSAMRSPRLVTMTSRMAIDAPHDSWMPPLDLAALARRLPASPLTRFAPSPTGYLHLGHVANAIYVWGMARVPGGRVLLRLEDHDRGRCRPEYEAALLDDLAWLGLEPDQGPPDELRAGTSTWRQSDCGEIY